MKHAVHVGDVEGAVLSAGGIIPQGVRKAPRKAAAPQPGSMPKWHAQHEARFGSRGLDWHSSRHFSEAELANFPTLAALTDRQVEILELAGVQSFPEDTPRAVEMKHSADRCRPGSHASCILPNGQQYLTHRCRFMLPYESLALQGIHVEPEFAQRFPRMLVQSLAGNAFETSCCLGTLCCTLVVLSRPHRKQEPVRSMHAPEQEGDDSDSDESLLSVRRRRLC